METMWLQCHQKAAHRTLKLWIILQMFEAF